MMTERSEHNALTELGSKPLLAPSHYPPQGLTAEDERRAAEERKWAVKAADEPNGFPCGTAGQGGG